MQVLCEFVLSLARVRAWHSPVVSAVDARPGKPGCRIHMPQGTALPLAPTGSQPAVSGLGPRPSSWDPPLGSFLPEIQSRA